MKMKRRDHLSECGGCGGSAERVLFLYNVRHRGTYRRLCTACVLNNHSGMFCPICFQVYHDTPPPPPDRLMCLNCPSISHLSCVSLDHVAPPRYQCPPCSNPNFSFFQMAESATAQQGQGMGRGRGRGVINKDSAKQLLAAAQIASASMNKASAVARVEAERRVKEATLARKRAREALEQVAAAYLAFKGQGDTDNGFKTNG